MKVSKIGILALACLAIISLSTGCKRHPKDITTINGKVVKPPPDPTPTTSGGNNTGNQNTKPDNGLGTGGLDNTRPITETKIEPVKPNADGGFDAAKWESFDDKYYRDPGALAGNTVYFEFDRHEVKSSERTKVDEVGVVLKGSPNDKLLIEGHCDERGTEEYNRSLGERRALSIREYLINSGISPERIHTVSFGEDKPAETGHNEAAWAKNRRGVFVLLKPKQ